MAANLQWNTVMCNFEIQWKALMEKKEGTEPEVPKSTKSLPMIKWSEILSTARLDTVTSHFLM